MAAVIMEGLEVDEQEAYNLTNRIVRVGPINMPYDLRNMIERMAEQENRSLSNMTRVLIERGISATTTRLREQAYGTVTTEAAPSGEGIT